MSHHLPSTAQPAGLHPAWIEVDVAALVSNARVLREVTPAGARLGILVKANAYGHGLVEGARAAVAGGADQLIVANLDEALALRGAGMEAPLLVVYPVPADGVPDAAAADIELSVSDRASARRTAEAAGRSAGRLKLHVEVDTGMGRGGVRSEDLPEVVKRLQAAPGTAWAGVWSHLADGRDPQRSGQQARRFESALAQLPGETPARHLVASEALFAETAPAYEMVRIGLAFYGELGVGFEPSARLAEAASRLRPAMTVKSRPVRLEQVPAGGTVGYGSEWTAERPSLIATLPVGYADGWARTSWPGAQALVRGRRVPLVGRVSMDAVCADVTELDGLTMDDEFVLLGAQGNDRITANELSRLRRTIPNEILCTFGPRLARRHLE